MDDTSPDMIIVVAATQWNEKGAFIPLIFRGNANAAGQWALATGVVLNFYPFLQPIGSPSLPVACQSSHAPSFILPCLSSKSSGPLTVSREPSTAPEPQLC